MFYFPYLCTRLTPTKIWQNRKFQYPTPLTSSTNKQNAKGVWRNFVPTTTRNPSIRWHQPKHGHSLLAWQKTQSPAAHSQKRKHSSSPKSSSTPSSSSTSDALKQFIIQIITKNKKFPLGQTSFASAIRARVTHTHDFPLGQTSYCHQKSSR